MITAGDISAALTSIKVLGDILKATKDLSNSTEILTAVNEIHQRLYDVLVKSISSLEIVGSLKTRISNLEEENAELKDWRNEAARYALTEICPGVVNFTIKTGQENGDPFHRLCANCFSKRQKGYLQQLEMTYDGTPYKCSGCDKEINDYSHKVPMPPFNRPNPSGWL